MAHAFSSDQMLEFSRYHFDLDKHKNMKKMKRALARGKCKKTLFMLCTEPFVDDFSLKAHDYGRQVDVCASVRCYDQKVNMVMRSPFLSFLLTAARPAIPIVFFFAMSLPF